MDTNINTQKLDLSTQLITVRESILDEAKGYITQDRNVAYGSPEENFGHIAEFWTTYLGTEVLAHDVAAMMILMKCARLKTSPAKRDHWVDVAGYAACGGETVSKTVANAPFG